MMGIMKRIGRPSLSLTTALAAGIVSAGLGGAVRADASADEVVMSAGEAHTLVIREGVPYAAGYNGYGQLTGSGSKARLTAMAGLPTGVAAREIAGGGHLSLVLGSDGIVYATGRGAGGWLGGSTSLRTLTPMTGLPPGVQARSITASGGGFALVVGSDHQVYGAGDNSSGQLTGTGPRAELTPLSGPAGIDIVEASAGTRHTLVLASDGAVYGAGSNADGQLTGTDTADRTSLTPVALPDGVTALDISAYGDSSVVLGSDDQVYGTGDNASGQLGGPKGTRSSFTLLPLPSGVRAQQVSAGNRHTLVLGSDQVVYGAGSAYQGQLGVYSSEKANATGLVEVGDLPAGVTPTGVSAGSYTTLVGGSDGNVYGTGSNTEGQLTDDGTGTSGYYGLRRLSIDVVGGTDPSTPAPEFTQTAGARLAPAQVGVASRAVPPALSPAPAWFTYEWRVGGRPVSRSVTFTPGPSSAGQRLSVTITAGREGFTPTSTAPPPVVIAAGRAPAYRGRAKITGKRGTNRILRLTRMPPSRWTPRPDRLTYQWLRDNKPIKHATRATYRQTRADRGRVIKVIVKARRAGHRTGAYTVKHAQVAVP